MSANLLDELPADARQLFRTMLAGGRRRDNGQLQEYAPQTLVKLLGWDQHRLRAAQDLLLAVELIERWPKVADGRAAFHVRLTVAGESLGLHGFSVHKFREQVRAAAVQVGNVSVHGSRDVNIAVGHAMGSPTARKLRLEDIAIAAEGIYSGNHRQAMVAVEVQVPPDQVATLCDAALTLGELTIHPDDVMTELNDTFLPGFPPASTVPKRIKGFARFAWHFYDRSGELGMFLLEAEQLGGILSVRCIEVGVLHLPTVVRRSSN